jgi:ribosomal protein S12 methylthiotransferase accessory factor
LIFVREREEKYMEKELKVSFPGGTLVNVEYKGFIIKTDQPLYAGGTGKEPTPFDLFLASIATCAGFYVMVFCKKRDISIEDISVVMRTNRNMETKMIDKITIDIGLPPEFPEKYKNAIVKSVNSCAVEAHILNPPEFEVKTS